jgi:molybdopterin-guanine dinucleotide biosynthesis protein A
MRPGNETAATAIVLAGGRSSRMGTPKALLLFDDRPLVVLIVAALRQMFDDVVVVAAPGQDLPSLPATLVRDEVPYQGPVGGLYYGLNAAGADICFVTACDSAFLNPQLVSYLVSQVAEYDIVVPHWEGRFQPLHAVYRRTVLPHLEEQLARNELRPVYLFDTVRTRTVREDEIRRFDPDGSSFFNMNTPDDYATALRRWQESSIRCTVELFGVARLVANTKEVSLVLPRGATLGHMVSALADKLPELVGRVISRDRRSLAEGYACNVNGLDFVRSSAASVSHGDNIVILSADAGG